VTINSENFTLKGFRCEEIEDYEDAQIEHQEYFEDSVEEVQIMANYMLGVRDTFKNHIFCHAHHFNYLYFYN
jgi:hypothetical protein